MVRTALQTKHGVEPIQPITESWIYHNAELWLISLSSNWTDWLTIADKNLGATTVYNDWDTLSEANCGKYYQWGNNYGFPRTWTVTTSSTKVNASSYWPWNYYSSNTFITGYNDWSSTNNANLRWWVTWTNEAMQWPCASWYHIPKNTERQSAYDIWVSLWIFSSSSGDAVKTYLKMPFAGGRSRLSSSVGSQGTFANYWSSNAYSTDYAYCLVAYSSTFYPQNSSTRASGYSIRPFKNEPVRPTVARTVIYKPS
mgnify:CR=1 FL=1